MSHTIVFVLILVASSPDAGRAHRSADAVVPLSKEWAPLAMITNIHALVHRRSGLAVCVLEADGLASVAENPISLFVVATNRGTSDLREYVWRLPHGLGRLKKVTVSKCGIDIAGEIDVFGGEQGVGTKQSLVIRACFIDLNGNLEAQLRVNYDLAPVAPKE